MAIGTAPDVLQRDILRTLLYYDIWNHPLTFKELFAFLPGPLRSPEEFRCHLGQCRQEGLVQEADGYYFLRGRPASLATLRKSKERRARWMWKAARVSAAVIRSFPFVRALFVSGELSKNVSSPGGDIDFVVVTEPGRLWIARSLLILFKKVFLLNRKKFFCLNYFVSVGHFETDCRNLYLAAEVAHLKPLYNEELFQDYLEANDWVRSFFPALEFGRGSPDHDLPSRPGRLQRLLEAPFALIDADRLDDFLLRSMQRVWARRYPQYDDETRNRIFRSTKHESRAYGGDYEQRVLSLYEDRLREFGLAD